jgi:photosynthetic reaction center cytochrome c subunit
MKTTHVRHPGARGLVLALAGLAAVLLSGCWERPPIETTQLGYRGTGMEQNVNPRIAAALVPLNAVPVSPPALPAGGILAKNVHQNVQVLGDLDANEFTRTMLAITAWVAPAQGCTYCHAAGEPLSSDKLYTKVVARKMLEMTRKINTDWQPHVAATGVTCYTCHRGNPVPQNIWFQEAGKGEGQMWAGNRRGQNRPGDTVGLASLPIDPFSPYLDQAQAIRVAGKQALPMGGGASIQATEMTYSLMTHMSKALGVNCTYCHNSRSFGDWEGSRPQRVTAWHGIRMVREVNTGYIEPLQPVFPATRLGPLGDVAKANCQTCHQGVFKPLYGAAMAKDFPALHGGAAAAASAPEAAAAPEPAASDAAPAVVSSGEPLARVLFAVGKSELDPKALDAIAAASKALTDDAALKVDLSGFADKTGSADKNMELAKTRAFAVRDALKAAGIAEDRINLRKPEFVIGGASADARRVDIVAAP